ncbi:MAG: Ig-like domain-containing protein, partial [Planctomycetota bacterium]
MSSLRIERLCSRDLLAVVGNGGFDVSDPADAQFGWSLSAPVAVEAGWAVIREDDASRSFLEQSFLLPAAATELQFDLESLALDRSTAQPPDTFEIALLDANTLQPIVPTLDGIPDADAFASFDADDRVYLGTQTSIPGVTSSGDIATITFPLTVSLDLSAITEDVQALLVFELLGFGAANAEVTLDDVRFDGDLPPQLTLEIDSADDSGVVGDGITNQTTITARGNGAPGQTVSLDLDGDGFDDGTVTVDSSGEFRFENVVLTDQLDVRVRADNAFGSTIIERRFRFDDQAPVAQLATPLRESVVFSDLGYVDVRWDEVVSGIDVSTVDVQDISISGVTVDRAEQLNEGIVRYHYADDGDALPYGPIRVELVDRAIADLAG